MDYNNLVIKSRYSSIYDQFASTSEPWAEMKMKSEITGIPFTTYISDIYYNIMPSEECLTFHIAFGKLNTRWPQFRETKFPEISAFSTKIQIFPEILANLQIQ